MPETGISTEEMRAIAADEGVSIGTYIASNLIDSDSESAFRITRDPGSEYFKQGGTLYYPEYAAEAQRLLLEEIEFMCHFNPVITVGESSVMLEYDTGHTAVLRVREEPDSVPNGQNEYNRHFGR